MQRIEAIEQMKDEFLTNYVDQKVIEKTGHRPNKVDIERGWKKIFVFFDNLVGHEIKDLFDNFEVLEIFTSGDKMISITIAYPKEIAEEFRKYIEAF